MGRPKKTDTERKIVAYRTDAETGEARPIYEDERVTIRSNKQYDYLAEQSKRQLFVPAEECKTFAKYWVVASVYIADNYLRKDKYSAATLFFSLLRYADYDNALMMPDGRIANASNLAKDLEKDEHFIRDNMRILFEDGLLGKIEVNKFRGHSDEFGSLIVVNPFVFCRTQTPLKMVVNAFRGSKFDPTANPELLERYREYNPSLIDDRD